MKKTVIAVAALAALTLAGCGTSEDEGQRAIPVPHVVQLEDGRSVDCIVFKSGYAGGLSCDWEGTR